MASVVPAEIAASCLVQTTDFMEKPPSEGHAPALLLRDAALGNLTDCEIADDDVVVDTGGVGAFVEIVAWVTGPGVYRAHGA